VEWSGRVHCKGSRKLYLYERGNVGRFVAYTRFACEGFVPFCNNNVAFGKSGVSKFSSRNFEEVAKHLERRGEWESGAEVEKTRGEEPETR
jgi:hypothetical protein